MKKGFITTLFIISLAIIVGGYIAYDRYKDKKTVGAPLSARYERELTPVTDSLYYLGTSSPSLKAWRGLIVDEICLDSDCKTAWPVGGGGSGGGTFSTTTSTHSGRLINYPNNATDIPCIGGTATSTCEVFFDPNIQSYRIGSSITASTTIMGNATTTGSHSLGALILNTDYFTDLTGTGLSVTNGVLNSSGAPFPYTVNTGYNSTTTVIGFLQGLFSTASSTFSSSLFFPSLSQGIVYTGSSGLVQTRATTTASCSGSVSCSGFDIFGSSPVTITGTDSTSSSTLLADTNSWTGVNRFGNASSTYHSFVTASTTNLIVNGETVTDLTGTGLSITGNALGLTNSTISGISLGSNLADLTATNGTLTFSGAYNGSTARTVGLNLGNANVWTAKQDFFGAASSTLFSGNWGAFGGTGTTTINTLGQLLVGTTTSWLNSMTNIVGTTTVKGQFSTLRASSTASATQNIDFSTGNFQDIMLTGNTNIVVNSTSSNPLDGGRYTLRICQDPTGSRTLTWANPIPLRWWNGTTTITSTANKCTMIGLIYSEVNGNSIYSIVASSTNIDIR